MRYINISIHSSRSSSSHHLFLTARGLRGHNFIAWALHGKLTSDMG
jgi:hypothetical protein